ncbi:MAG: formate--phosphoribosylaminoimidazolecarboxamide ligase [Candidatus Caldarchaeum sp.]
MKQVRDYDVEKLMVATVASHTALQLLRAAKKTGFRTAAICLTDNKPFYEKFGFIDEIYTAAVDTLDKLAPKLAERNTVFIPHGSFVEYCGPKKAQSFKVPFFGTRQLIEVEADQRRKMMLLREAGIPTPEEYSSPEEAEPPVIIKLAGAKGGAGYFLAFTKQELEAKTRNLNQPYIIQRYIIGVGVYMHYFSSQMFRRVEVFGADTRYEANVDGRVFGLAEPSFVVVGNRPVVVRESLLPRYMRFGEQFASAVEDTLGTPMIGPFCLETIITDKFEIKCFEFSGRIVAGTNVYMGTGSPYSVLYFDKPMDMGERIAHELKVAAEKNCLEKITS